jgi:predicted acyltransferase
MGPFAHGEWNEITPTDWVFPFFLFIVGVSMPFSFARRLDQPGRRRWLYVRIARRTAMLFLVGWAIHLTPDLNWRELRVLGVLPRIGLCYLFTALIVLHFGRRVQITALAALLLGYWALMEWVPFPGKAEFAWARGDAESANNLAQYLDRLILGVHMDRPYDMETKGILSTLPAITNTLAGYLSGEWIRSRRSAPLTPARPQKTGGEEGTPPRNPLPETSRADSALEVTNGLFVWGTLGLLVAIFWSYWAPFGLGLWTPSCALFMSAMGMLILAVCYWAVDVRGGRVGVGFCVVFGANSIFAFAGSQIVSRLIGRVPWLPLGGEEVSLCDYAYKGMLSPLAGPYWGSILWGLLHVALWWSVCAVLYRSRIFIKI